MLCFIINSEYIRFTSDSRDHMSRNILENRTNIRGRKPQVAAIVLNYGGGYSLVVSPVLSS